MKKVTALLLSLIMLLNGCNVKDIVQEDNIQKTADQTDIIQEKIIEEYDTDPTENITEVSESESVDYIEYNEISIDRSYFNSEEYIQSLSYMTADDSDLHTYIKDSVYSELVEQLDCDDYFVSDVTVSYMPSWYYEDLEYNSKENIYFDYKASELNEVFQGTKYVFSLAENGQTIVQEMKELEDDTFDRIIKNIVIGSGVILINVTLAAAGGPLQLFFQTSAKEAAIYAASGAAIGAIAAAIVKGIETRNVEETLKASALVASEGFKWGAIVGATGADIKDMLSLYSDITHGKGLSLNEAAFIQNDTGWPVELIKHIADIDEYKLLKEAGIKTTMINGSLALITDLALNYKVLQPDGTELTNLQLMLSGRAPVDPVTKKAYEIFNLSTKSESEKLLAILPEHLWEDLSVFNDIIKNVYSINKMSETKSLFWLGLGKTITGIIENIDYLLNTIPTYDKYTYGSGASPEEIKEAESKLQLSFSEEYKDYLLKYSCAVIDHKYITGITSVEYLDVIDNTITEKQRCNKVPADMYVIERLSIDNIVLWQDQTGAVYQTAGDSEPVKIYDSLSDYIRLG